jgi:hypothetical protein
MATPASTDTFIALAVERLSARTYGDRYAHLDDGTPGVVHLVDSYDMVDLGRRIAEGDPEAYSLWCSDTDAVSCTLEDALAAWTTDAPSDEVVAHVRAQAVETGNTITIAAIDMLR